MDELRGLIAGDKWTAWNVPDGAKRVVTFLSDDSPSVVDLPLVHEDATVFGVSGRQVFSAYVPGSRGGAFMSVIERTFGKDVTTRTWDTLRRVAR